MLEQHRIPVEQTADARKEVLAGEAAWQLLSQASEILVATGKKVQTFDSSQRQICPSGRAWETGTCRTDSDGMACRFARCSRHFRIKSLSYLIPFCGTLEKIKSEAHGL